jgi:AraC-like DNA-binding protein
VAVAVSDYREFPPPRALAEYFVCFWTQTIHSPVGFAQRVLPDCCVDILLLNDAPIVVGPWTESYVAPLPPRTKILGARCHPGFAPSLLGMPASELLNCIAPLSDVWGSEKTARFARLADELALPARISAMESALLRYLADSSPVDKATSAAIRWISRHPHGRVEQLSQWLGLSSRQIQRRFTIAVGYGPKLFQSVLRFQRLLHVASNSSAQAKLVDLSAEAGYSDQAHMTREVQRFSGIPPSVSLQSPRCTLRLSGLIQSPDSLDS